MPLNTKLRGVTICVLFSGFSEAFASGLLGHSITSQAKELPSTIGAVGIRGGSSTIASSFGVHPAVLDSCLHMGAYLGLGASESLRIPSGLEAFTVRHAFGEHRR